MVQGWSSSASEFSHPWNPVRNPTMPRWEDQKSHLIYQLFPRKAHVKAMEELNSLLSWEAHHNVLGSFPQDVWNRWFNHFTFLVLATWLQRMTSLPTTTTTGTFHNPSKQHVYPTLRTESRLSPSVLSYGNLSVSLVCNQHELQNNRVYLPTARRVCAALSGHPCISVLIQFHLRRTTCTQHTADALVRSSHFTAVNNSLLKVDNPLTSKSDHPLQGSLQKSTISIRSEYNRYIKLCATGQMEEYHSRD